MGYLTFDAGKKKPDRNILTEYMISLEENSYDKIWEELSVEERRIVMAIAESGANPSVKEIRERLGIDSNKFSTYQSMLLNSGILSSSAGYGRVGFELPYFERFLKSKNL